MNCPRCSSEIQHGLYCTNCGFVPDWRELEIEEIEAQRSYHQLEECRDCSFYCERCKELEAALDNVRGNG